MKARAMTEGPILSPILSFTIPILLTSLLQTLYNAVDSVIVGQFAENGQYALGAVGSAGAIHNLFVGFFIGISAGAGVVVAQYFGARNNEGVSNAVHTSMMLSILIGIFITVAGVLLCPAIVSATNTPPEIHDLSVNYLKILFYGMLPSIVYNFGAGILRSIGDSKRPLIYLIVSSIVNVIFNCIFVINMGMSVDGVAWATVIAQTLTAALVVIRLLKTDECYKLIPQKLRITKKHLLEILRVGIPSGLQSVMFNISNVIVQTEINAFGATVVAARAAVSKYEGMLYAVANSFGLSVTTFSGQNKGARQFDRIIRGTNICLVTITSLIAALSVVSIIFRNQIVGIFNSDPSVIGAGNSMFIAMIAGYFIVAIMEVLSGSIRGAGQPLLPMISTTIGIFGGRIAWIYITKLVFGASPLLVVLSYPVSWIIISSAMYIYFTKYRNRWLYD